MIFLRSLPAADSHESALGQPVLCFPRNLLDLFRGPPFLPFAPRQPDA